MQQCLSYRKARKGKQNNSRCFMIVVCVKLARGVNFYCPLISLVVQDSQTLSVSELWQGRVL